MQSGTAIGLLVGGAVLLLAVAPPRQPVIGANGQPVAAPGGSLNPFNWFGQSAANPFAAQQQQQIPQQQPQSYAAPNNGGFQNAGYSQAGSPYVSPGGYTPGGQAYQTTANTQYGQPVSQAYQTTANTQYGSPAGSPSFQNAGYSPAGSSPQYYDA